MSVEDHPKFKEWKAALEELIDATDAFREGLAFKYEVDEAKEAYYKIADEIQEASDQLALRQPHGGG